MKKGAVLTLFICCWTALFANQAIFYTPYSGVFSYAIEEPASISLIKEALQDVLPWTKEEMLLLTEEGLLRDEEDFFPDEGQKIWVVSLRDFDPTIKKPHERRRDYERKVTEMEKNDLRFIMKTLATKSVASLFKHRVELEAAGNRIDPVHPLRFLEAIFTDEELKVFMHNIRSRGGWVWGEFIKGIKGSLQDEFEIGNLTDAMLFDFSFQVGIDLSKIQSLIQGHRWEDFVKVLIVYIPREGDPSRYDQ